MPVGFIGPAIGGVTSLVGGGKQADAAGKAAQAQVQAAQIAAQTQLQMFGEAKNLLSPFIDYGRSALPSIQRLTGTGEGGDPLTAPLTSPIQTQWPMFQMDEAHLRQTPGWQFQMDVGTETIANQMASKGLRMGGAFGTALQQYTTGLADTTYTQQLNNYLAQVGQQMQMAGLTMNDRTRIYNMLTGQASTGLSAAGALTGAAINTGGQVAQTQMAAGGAQAAGIIGQANALTGGLSGVGNAASNIGLMYAMNQGGLFGGGTSATGFPFNAGGNYGWGPSSGTSMTYGTA